MIALGLKKDFKDAEGLEPFKILKPPTERPRRARNKIVIGGLLDNEGRENLYLCESLKEMKLLYECFATCKSQELKWYRLPNPKETGE